MPSWIAFVWRSVLPVADRRSSRCSRGPRAGRARRRRSPSCRPRSRDRPRPVGARAAVGVGVSVIRYRPASLDVAPRRRRARGSGSGGRPRRAGGPATRRRRCAACRRTRTRSAPRSAGRAARAMSARPHALALGDAELGQLEHRPRARASSGRERAMSPPTMKVSSSSGRAVMQRPQGIDRVRRAGPSALDARDAEPLVAGHGAPAQLDAVLRARVRSAALVRRRRAPAPAARGRGRAARAPPGRRRDAPMCGGLNVPPRRPSAGHYGRTWPSPSTRYLNVHSSRRPIGPRACSFCVELPISAPIPNSPPSVKRVEALT